MLRRKQDVDRHVTSILGKIKEERDKHSRGYQIARLYCDVGEYGIAKRYLTSFLGVRDSVPQAYRLLGEIEEAIGNDGNAIEAYKQYANIGGTEKEILLRICRIYVGIGVDAGVGKYWLEKAEKACPHDVNVFTLKEKLIKATTDQNGDGDFEHLISSELVRKPRDIGLKIKMLELYLTSGRVDQAYENASQTDSTLVFSSSLAWYECLHNVFEAYMGKEEVNTDTRFIFHHLLVLCNLSYLRLTSSDVDKSAEALQRFDQEVQSAMSVGHCLTKEYSDLLTELQGQLFFLSGNLLLKRAQKGSVSWNDVQHPASVFYFLCLSVPTIDAQAGWYVQPSRGLEKLYGQLYKSSFFRISQSGHILNELCSNSSASWLHQLQLKYCTPIGQEGACEMLFSSAYVKGEKHGSFLLSTHKFCCTTLALLSEGRLYNIDRVALTFLPDQLAANVWLCLQRCSRTADYLPGVNISMFDMVQYGVRSLEHGSAETFCQLDAEAFLYAAVRCADQQSKKKHLSVSSGDVSPSLLPLCLHQRLCTPDQQEWWQTACDFSTNNVKDDFVKMRHVLQRGIEVVRLIGSHGLSVSMVTYLARCFDIKAKNASEDIIGRHASISRLSFLKSRAAFYWLHASTMLSRLERNQHGSQVKVRLFDDGNDGDMTPSAFRELIQEAKFATASIAMQEERYEEAVHGFEELHTPYASFNIAQIYRNMAGAAMQKQDGADEVRRQKYAALLSKSKGALYMTMDRLAGNRDHELNVQLTQELDDIELKLNCANWGTNQFDAREEVTSVAFVSPLSQQNGGGDDVAAPHSTPMSAGRYKSVPNNTISRFRGSPILPAGRLPAGRLPADRLPASPYPVHSRPSPERLDAEIKSINYTQSQLFKMVLDRNEELVVMYKALVEELRESTVQLKSGLADNRDLMVELKAALGSNRIEMDALKVEIKTTVLTAVTAGDGSSNSNVLAAQNLAVSQMNAAAGYVYGLPLPYHQAQFPAYTPLPNVPGGFLRYPLLPMYPSSRPSTPILTVTSTRLNEQPGGTARSSFGKVRSTDHHHVADGAMVGEGDVDDGTVVSLSSVDYGEYVARAPASQYPVSTAGDASRLPDWIPPAQYSAAGEPVDFPSDAQRHMPQPQTAYDGPAGSVCPAVQQDTVSSSVLLTMPGPGYFSSLPVSSAASHAAAVMTSLVSKSHSPVSPGLTPAQVTEAGLKSSLLFTGADKSTTEVTVFRDTARLSSQGFGTQPVDVEVFYDTSMHGCIELSVADSHHVLGRYHMDSVEVMLSREPNCFVFSVLTGAQNSTKETVTLRFDSIEQSRKMKASVDTIVKGVKLSVSAAAVSSSQPYHPSPMLQGGSYSAFATAQSSVTTTSMPAFSPASSLVLTCASTTTSKTVFGGFTFSTSPVFRTNDMPRDGKATPRLDSQFRLKESTLEEFSTPVTASTSAPSVNPFAGFSLSPLKLASSVSSSTATLESASTTWSVSSQAGMERTFPFGQSSMATSPSSASMTVPNFASLAAEMKGDAVRPKDEGLLVLASPLKLPVSQDDDSVEEYEPNVTFTPLVDLPALVEVKTGEEDESVVLSDRVRLFRFDREAKQWKERGVGEMKILQSTARKRFRVLMRRDQVLKVCANHYISPEMKLCALNNSDSAWCYTAPDFSEEECRTEKFAIKFKNSEQALLFKDAFEACQYEMSKKAVSISSPGATVAASGEVCLGQRTSVAAACAAITLLPEQADVDKRVDSLRISEAGSHHDTQSSSAFDRFDVSSVKKTVDESPLSELFKPEVGSWECSGCYIRNRGDVVLCPACQTLKPGVKSEDVKAPSQNLFVAPSDGGFVFGGVDIKKDASSTVSTGGFIFGGAISADESSGFKFGMANEISATSASSAGFQVPASGTYKFKFGTTVSSCASTASSGFVFGRNEKLFHQTMPFSGFKFASSASGSQTKDSSFVFGTAQQSSEQRCTGSGLLEKLLESDKPDTSNEPIMFPEHADVASIKPSFQSMLGHVTSPAGVGDNHEGFQFTFSLQKDKQVMQQPQVLQQVQPKSPRSPDVEANGYYVNKEEDDVHIYFEPVVELPEMVDVKTGEEEETALFEAHAKLFQFVGLDWKERGVGVMMILRHDVTGKVRLLMRRDQVFKICCNHFLTNNLTLKPMPGSGDKAWIWYAVDFSFENGKVVQLAVRFRDAETAACFKDVFDVAKEGFVSPSSDAVTTGDLQPIPQSEFPVAVTSDAVPICADDREDDVVFLYEERLATREQVARARELMLPDNFYLYESRAPCPGCIGCEESFEPVHHSLTAGNWIIPRVENIAGKAEDVAAKGEVISDRSTNVEAKVEDVAANAENIADKAEDVAAKGEVISDKSTDVASKVDDVAAKAENIADKSRNIADKSKNVAAKVEDIAGKAEDVAATVEVSTTNLQKVIAADGDCFPATDPEKPFQWAGAGEKMFGREDTPAAEDDVVAENEDAYFEPVIALPDLVDCKTGEEDWTPLFSQRARLYRFDGGQWKERGVGEMKISRHNSKLMFRVLMRREQVLKIATNHLISLDMSLKPSCTSESAWCWVANDTAEGQAKVETLSVKFKKVESAVQFKQVFEQCQELIRQGSDAHVGRISPHRINPSPCRQAPTDQAGSAPTRIDVISSTADIVGGDGGNYQHETSWSGDTQDTCVSSTTVEPSGNRAGDGVGEPSVSDEAGRDQRYEECGDAYINTGCDDDEGVEYYEYEGLHGVDFEKRVTLFCVDGDDWKGLGMGWIHVWYDGDYCAIHLEASLDSGAIVCSHLIFMEMSATLVGGKSCDWLALDNNTGEPLSMKANFSSTQAAEEFVEIFNQGIQLAAELELSADVLAETGLSVLCQASD